jgi:hypothetical protein
MVVGTGFEASGLSKHNALNKCKPNCTQAEVSSDRTTFAVGDVSLGIGIAALATAAVLFFTRSSATADTRTDRAWFTFEALGGGGGASLDGRF